MKPELTITFPGNKRVDAEWNGWVIHTDQSQLSGGNASAPEPFALFLASIGTCAGIYVHGFLDARDLSSEGIVIKQKLEVDDKGQLSGVELDIQVPDTIPEKYHAALIRVSNMCAVKKTIQDGLQFDVHVSKATTSSVQPMEAASLN